MKREKDGTGGDPERKKSYLYERAERPRKLGEGKKWNGKKGRYQAVRSQTVIDW